MYIIFLNTINGIKYVMFSSIAYNMNDDIYQFRKLYINIIYYLCVTMGSQGAIKNSYSQELSRHDNKNETWC